MVLNLVKDIIVASARVPIVFNVICNVKIMYSISFGGLKDCSVNVKFEI